MVIRCCQQVSDGKSLKLSHDWVSLDEMSPSLPVAVIASEDGRFMEHHGFDYKAIEHAAKRNREHPEKRKLGASTISQQTAKNVFLWPGRSWVRKGFEGAQAVAEEHFGKDAKNLTRSECALIAATLPNPRKYSSKSPSAYMLKRQARILREMKHVGAFPTKK